MFDKLANRRFNSTLVQLKVVIIVNPCGIYIRFNSTLVQLKDKTREIMGEGLYSFNSTLVQLKAALISIYKAVKNVSILP